MRLAEVVETYGPVYAVNSAHGVLATVNNVCVTIFTNVNRKFEWENWIWDDAINIPEPLQTIMEAERAAEKALDEHVKRLYRLEE